MATIRVANLSIVGSRFILDPRRFETQRIWAEFRGDVTSDGVVGTRGIGRMRTRWELVGRRPVAEGGGPVVQTWLQQLAGILPSTIAPAAGVAAPVFQAPPAGAGQTGGGTGTTGQTGIFIYNMAGTPPEYGSPFVGDYDLRIECEPQLLLPGDVGERTAFSFSLRVFRPTDLAGNNLNVGDPLGGTGGTPPTSTPDTTGGAAANAVNLTWPQADLLGRLGYTVERASVVDRRFFYRSAQWLMDLLNPTTAVLISRGTVKGGIVPAPADFREEDFRGGDWRAVGSVADADLARARSITAGYP